MENFRICPSAEKCGGCCYQGVSYEDQLKNKAGEVRRWLADNGMDPEILSGIKPCTVRAAYRNKMEYTFGDEVKGGEMHLGLHQKGSFMNIIDVSECQLVPEDFNRILAATLGFAREKGYKHYHKKTHEGLCRSLVLRRGVRSGELVVNIVTSSESLFDEEGYIKKILSLQLDNTVVGILHTINDAAADAVICDELRVLWGREYYNEEILGLKFQVGPFSFFQTNVEAAERLYSDALSLIDGLEGKTVYDLYCGTGTITQAMALKAKKAIGVEIVEEAVQTARESARVNGLTNCEFIAEDVNTALSKIAEKPDIIVVDPPRSGIIPKAMQQILDYGVQQIIYISCNPKTMAINLKTARMCGYEVKSLQAYDNFPFTKHTEAIAVLEKTSAILPGTDSGSAEIE